MFSRACSVKRHCNSVVDQALVLGVGSFSFLHLSLLKWLLSTAVLLVCVTVAQAFVNESMLVRLKNQYGEAAYVRGKELTAILHKLNGSSEMEKLTAINDYFNSFQYVEDSVQWQQQDYWATPEEFLGTFKGDCEDFVIAKYFSLLEAGVNKNKLFLTYVKMSGSAVSHMVLTYFEKPGAIPLVLDNYDRRILQASQRQDLRPVYSFNIESLFLTNASAGLTQKLPTDKVKNSKWDKLLSNLEKTVQ